MFTRTRAQCCLLAFVLLSCFGVSLFGQTQIASLRPHAELHWQRVSPTAQQPDGPVLYQLLFSASGTPGTVPAFDTNPRHLTNSPITVSGNNINIAGTATMAGFHISGGAASGKVLTSDATGNGTWQPAPNGGGGTVTSVGTGAGLTGGPITTTGTISIPDGGVTNSMLNSNSRISISKTATSGLIALSTFCTNFTGVSITVTAPAGVAGKVLVRADVVFSISHTFNAGTAWQIYLATDTFTCNESPTGTMRSGLPDALPTDIYTPTMSVSGMFPVAAGSATTFYLNGKRLGLFLGPVNFWSGAMDAIFVPQ